jgi:intracellular sulfur oxidation DsrE/DsrF family protein
MKSSMILVAGAFVAGLVSLPVHADGTVSSNSNNACPVDLVSGKSMDEEFGPGTQELTRCLKKRNQVKMVVQVNQFCTNNTSAATCAASPYALGNIRNIIDDYEITHGMERGKDYEIAVILHSPGGRMALKNTGLNSAGEEVTDRNPFQSQIEALMAKGVKFYFCQNTTRAYLGQAAGAITSLPAGNATAQIIPGIEYTTAGLTSLADFQAQGYQYIQP